jgi:asparagine synthase (glutamine-hydrolysing)
VAIPGFYCALPKTGHGLPLDFRHQAVARAEATLRGVWQWIVEPVTGALFGVVASPDRPRSSTPRIISTPLGILVGNARLDDSVDGADDLGRIAAVVGQGGADAVRGLIGDFAFVYWDIQGRRAVAARDAFGVRALYRREFGDVVAFSSSASALLDREEYDPEYAAEFLLNGYEPTDRTPFLDVRTVPAGSLATLVDGLLRVRPYWSVAEFQPAEDGAPEYANTLEVVAEWRALFERAVKVRLGGDRPVWSMLSGGVDSSAIVSVAGALARRGDVGQGLGGTVSIVDSYDDEGPHQRAVVEAYGLRNETIVDDWLWREDGIGARVTDEPHPLFGFYARNRRLCDTVRNAGANVLLSGTGPDHYLAGNLSFFADMVARGQLGTAVRELGRWAVLANQSFWRFAGEHAIEPLLPLAVRRMFAPPARPPAWFQPTFARQRNLRERTIWLRSNRVSKGRMYAGYIEFVMGHIPPSIDRGEFEDGIEIRYPFLDRPLVEFSLRLPPGLRTRPHARKWVQREAVKGVLPESVRTRRSKGGIVGSTRSSLMRQDRVITDLLRDPIVEQLGYVDPGQLRAAVDRAVGGDDLLLFEVVRALSFETWLRARTGRWHSRGAVTGSDRGESLPAQSHGGVSEERRGEEDVCCAGCCEQHDGCE